MRKDQERLEKIRAKQDQLVGDVAVKQVEEKEARCMAIAIALERWFQGRAEAERVHVFSSLEVASKGRNRKRIASHPLRPTSLPPTP